MACEGVNISVLVVDDDEISLAILANILIAWKYKVITAKSVRNAMETLREFEGFFDLVITELHISGMSGFEFQKRVRDEFQLPVIMMSADSRKNVISKSLENGAALYILKPFCADDFKDIWQYAVAARKGKQVIENGLRIGELGESVGENVFFQDVFNSPATSSSAEPKRKRKYSKRNSQKGDKIEGRSRVMKKPKIVWTTYLHNLFLLAIKQIGLDKAVPKRILEIMNIPNLTRENVASHLQKYRIFLRNVTEKGITEGLTVRALRSKFASSLPASVIQDILTRTKKIHVPAQEYLERISNPTRNDLKPFNQVPIGFVDHQVSSNNTNVTTQLGRGDQFPYKLRKGMMLQNQHGESLNQVRLGQSSFGSNIEGPNNIHQNMLASHVYPPYQANSSYNAGAIFPAYGGGHGLMTSAKGLTEGLKYGGDPVYQNYGSTGNHNFSYGIGNWNNMGSFSGFNIQPQTSTYHPSSNSIGFQLNDIGPEMVGTVKKGRFNGVSVTAATANNNNFGFISGTQNANMNVASLGHENFGLIQGQFGFDCVSNARDGGVSELPAAALITSENSLGITQLPQQQLGGNVVGNEHQYDNAISFSEGEVNQLEDDLSELFFMLDGMNLLNEMEENLNVSEFSNSNLSNFYHIVQPLEQSDRDGHVIVPPAKSTSNLPNEPPTSWDKISNQLRGDDGFGNGEPYERFLVDNVSSASTSATNQDWDMELIEALFGTEAN